MATRITATELGRHLSDVLSRVRYRGERFVIDRNGEAVAALGPTHPTGASGAVPHGSWRALAERLKRLTPGDAGDPGFADDLERIQDTQQQVALPEWPS